MNNGKCKEAYYESGIYLIQLTRGHWTQIDADDYDKVKNYNWHATVNRRTAYACRRVVKKPKSIFMYMHRLIANAPDGLEVDHINGNGLDNRRSNLRIADNAKNAFNKRNFKKPSSSSKYKGVSWNTLLKKWQSKLQYNKKPISLGLFNNEEDAARAYNTAANKYFGEFALLNDLTNPTFTTEQYEDIRRIERKHRGSSSKYIGVHRPNLPMCPSQRKWTAAIRINGKAKHIGVYDIEEDAARAYNEFAKLHLGDKALLNKIGDSNGE